VSAMGQEIGSNFLLSAPEGPIGFTDRNLRKRSNLLLSAPEGRRGGVRWGLAKRTGNRRQDAVEIIEHVAVPEPKNAIAMPRELVAATIIGVLFKSVLAAVELDCELMLRAGEVDDAPSDRMLPPKLPADKTLSQSVPEDALDVRGVSPQAPCPACSRPYRLHRPTSPCLSAPEGRRGEEQCSAGQMYIAAKMCECDSLPSGGGAWRDV